MSSAPWEQSLRLRFDAGSLLRGPSGSAPVGWGRKLDGPEGEIELRCGQDRGVGLRALGRSCRVVSGWGKQEAGLYTPPSTAHRMQAPLSTQHPDGLSSWVGSPFDQGQFGGVS